MKVKVLFVCMGNLCRSPSAVGVLRRLVETAGLQDRILIDSAGTHQYHVGEPPDHRAQFIARKRGYCIDDLRAKQVRPEDVQDSEMVLAMDWEVLTHLKQITPRHQQHKLMLLMRYANDYEEASVADPYYGGLDAFVKMFDYLEDACQGVFEVLSKRVTQYSAHQDDLF